MVFGQLLRNIIALVHMRRVASKKQPAVYTGRSKDADGFIFSLIFVKGWLIGIRSRERSTDSSFFNYKKLLSPCRKSTVNIKSKFFIALFYLSLFALQKFHRQPDQKIFKLTFNLNWTNFRFWRKWFICKKKFWGKSFLWACPDVVDYPNPEHSHNNIIENCIVR